MGVLEKLSRLVVGTTTAASHAAIEALQQCYVEAVRQARQLARHAEMAPQHYSVQSLTGLARGEERHVETLRQALRAADTAVPDVPDERPPAGALNHWGRLVQDLEAHRAVVRRMRELAVHFAESQPTAAALFDELCHDETVHCEQLRELIARADPQALD